jgi:anti-anti-sigma regulatory factor
MMLKHKVKSLADSMHIEFAGSIDECSEWPDLGDQVNGDLVIDLSGVGLLNSMGVRGWIQWLGSLKVERDVMLVNCSPPVVKQINILNGFLNDRTKILSIQVPYFCEDCGFEENKGLVISELPENPTPPLVVHSYACVQCGKNMELDMVESQYLAFLKCHRQKFAR